MPSNPIIVKTCWQCPKEATHSLVDEEKVCADCYKDIRETIELISKLYTARFNQKITCTK